jgi:hypothetical protein
MKLTIHHRFLCTQLVSPLYYSDGAICHPQFDQRVDAGSTMQTEFNINPARDMFTGTLMYKLQRKDIDQFIENIIFSEDNMFSEDNVFSEDSISSEEEEVTCIQFFMVWKVYRSGAFYVYLSLLEHDKDRI